jgi:hypothetical protein
MSEQRPKIWLLGASFETPNMVSVRWLRRV